MQKSPVHAPVHGGQDNQWFGNKMNPGDLIVEARAKIIWGEASSSVRYFLTSNGMSAADADAKIREFTLERNAEIRKLGIKNVLIGVALIGVAGIFFYSMFASSHMPRYQCKERQGLWRPGPCGSVWAVETGEWNHLSCSPEIRARLHT